MGVVDRYAMNSFLVQLSTEVVVVWDQLLVVGVERMTHLKRTKIVGVFASPIAEVFESHKAIEIGNEISSLRVPHLVPPTAMVYISSIESESSRNMMHQAMLSNLA